MDANIIPPPLPDPIAEGGGGYKIMAKIYLTPSFCPTSIAEGFQKIMVAIYWKPLFFISLDNGFKILKPWNVELIF